ncbi:hypothetical protein DB88DRAFT_476362 [Papiliotrema laurentii]|uniref:Hemerythrin-like domain-containing protein n=1 Tax=Papiliotrema laurentii TaxID=5418 RepID=A0AAD9L972_PAPLA|nr:hypothetical protein DB88DRAFT_476362 [Papiliotrema laurentii]
MIGPQYPASLCMHSPPVLSDPQGSSSPITAQTLTTRRARPFSRTAVSLIVLLCAILLAPVLLRRVPRAGFESLIRNHTAVRPLTTTTPVHTMPSKMSLEDKQWNSLADRMNLFHNHFRYEFDRVYKLCDGGFHKEGMKLADFLREAQELHHHLHMHHTIEETYIFPVLAKKMPQFKDGARESGQHLQAHKAIHDGLDKYEAFLKASLANPNNYSAATLRGIMDGFKDVLFRHLDEEVRDLGAESMKAAGWTLAELKRIPM